MFGLFKPTSEKAQKRFQKAAQTGDFRSAIAYYRKYVDQNEEDFRAQNDLGWMLLQSGQPEEAVSYLKMANEINEDGVHYNNLGRALLALSRFEEADQAFDDAEKLDPENPEPAYNKTVSLRTQDDQQGAMAALEVVIERHPEYAPALNDYALYLEDADRKDEMVEYLERAVAARPSYVPSRLNLIRSLCELGRFPDSKPHLETLHQMGVPLKVITDDKRFRITLGAEVFYEGDLNPEG